MPASVDVLVVGSGYTGLNAALVAARGGRSVVIVERGDAGDGCSTRNGGQISTSIKPSLAKLTARFGRERALAIRREGQNALSWIGDFLSEEGISCAFNICGRFHAAHTPKHFEGLRRDADRLNAEESQDIVVVDRKDQRRELGSDAYFGGVVFPQHASLHPGRYHRGLLERVIDAGARLFTRCEAQAIEREADSYLVRTSKGRIKARDLIIATNGYTGALTPWMRQRVVPIGSYIIATEALPAALMDRLFPTNRIASDTCKVVYYYRPSPDRRRVLFGGRVSARETDPLISGPRLYRDMCRIFPELASYRIRHSWMGTVAYSFDDLAHSGCHDGIHYAMAYCGSGVSMASYLGMRLGQRLLGLPQGRTAFDDLPFPTRPTYSGNPWFLPPLVAYYRWRDRLDRRLAASTA